jgi:hypothetical protein
LTTSFCIQFSPRSRRDSSIDSPLYEQPSLLGLPRGPCA